MKFKFFLKKSFYSFLGNNKKLDINEKNLIIKSENKNWVLNQLANEYKKAFLIFHLYQWPSVPKNSMVILDSIV